MDLKKHESNRNEFRFLLLSTIQACPQWCVQRPHRV
jgi:hypothetical protein